MEVGRDDIVESVVRLINGVGRSPYLFVGSGFSRRYMGTDDWVGLLRHLCSRLSDDPFRLDSYLARCPDESDNSALPSAATMLDKDMRIAVLEDPRFASFRNDHVEDIRQRKSILKIMAAERLSSFKPEYMTHELDILREVGRRRISGVITTNYDCLLELLFPEFKVFVGQDDLVFHRTFEMGEIYKIHGSMDNPESMVLEEADYAKLAETQDYLAAKLLTIFMEYPIILALLDQG